MLNAGQFFSAMMLSIVALVAWSPVSVATATLVPDAVDTPDTTYIPVSKFNTEMETSHRAFNAEERVNLQTVALSEAQDLLWIWHNLVMDGIPELDRPAKLAKATLRIKAMRDLFSDLFGTMKPHDNIFESPNFRAWIDYVRLLYPDSAEPANAAMFLMLANHFGKENLASVLVAGTTVKDTEGIAGELLDILISSWNLDSQDAAYAFKHLELEKTQGNIFKSVVFSKWVAFVKSRFKDSEQAAIEAIFDVLAECYKGDHLARLLVSETKVNMEGIAEMLLDVQIKTWIRNKKPASEIIKLLELDQQPGDPFTRAAYSKWVTYVVSRFPNVPNPEILAMFSVKASHHKGDLLATALVKETKDLDTKDHALKQLDFQVRAWANEKRNAAETFKLLELEEEKEENLFSNPFFIKWVIFVNLRYHGDLDIVYMAMASTLEDCYKGDLMKALDAGKEIDSTIAEALLKLLKEGLPKPITQRFPHEEPAPT